MLLKSKDSFFNPKQHSISYSVECLSVIASIDLEIVESQMYKKNPSS